MSLETLLDDMVAKLATDLPELAACELTGGLVNLTEMRRRSTAFPGAYLTCTATKDGRVQSGKLFCRGYFLLVLAVDSRVEGKPTPQDRAHAIVRLLGRALHKVAAAGNWGNDQVVSKPEKVSSSNPYNAEIDRNNLALWGITWEQDLELVFDAEPAVLPDLTSIHTDYQMTESTNDVDADDEIDTDGP